MNKIYFRLKLWYLARREARRKDAERQRLREANERINIMEFNQRLYIAVDGKPYVRVDDLAADQFQALSNARAAWVCFEGRNDHGYE